jgi:uncharacterized protein (DUF2141 family)
MFAAPIAALAILTSASDNLPSDNPARVSDSAERASLDIAVSGLRSDQGKVMLMVCPERSPFPACTNQASRKELLTIAKKTAKVQLTGLAPGRYAVAVFHDANSNGKLDTFMGIPREGYGFSRNPPFRPRAPRFAETQIDLSGQMRIDISLRYLF